MRDPTDQMINAVWQILAKFSHAAYYIIISANRITATGKSTDPAEANVFRALAGSVPKIQEEGPMRDPTDQMINTIWQVLAKFSHAAYYIIISANRITATVSQGSDPGAPLGLPRGAAVAGRAARSSGKNANAASLSISLQYSSYCPFS